MKTSNKLLIALGTSLIIVPIVIMLVAAKTHYTTGPEPGMRINTRHQENYEPFEKKSVGKISIPIASSFNSISFVDAKGLSTEVKFIKSEQFGVKIPENMKDFLNFNVDKNGTLNVTLKDGMNEFASNDAIIFYGSKLNKFDINNGGVIEFSAKTDSLLINAKNTSNFCFGSAYARFNDKGKPVEVVEQNKIGHLNLNLDHSNINNIRNSFEHLLINAKGNSEVQISGDMEENNKYSIESLTINTTDTARLDLNNIEIKKISGNISDQTTVQMQTIYLKQLFKK